MALASCEAAHVLGVERVREREDRGGCVEVVGVSEPELPVLVLPPRVHLLLGRDSEVVPRANNHVREDLVLAILEARHVRVAALLDRGRLEPCLEVALAELAFLVAAPRERAPVVRDTDGVVRAACDHRDRIVIQRTVDSKRRLQVRLRHLACAVAEFSVVCFPPGAHPPDVPLHQSRLGLLDEDASFELMLQGRGDRDSHERGDLMLAARQSVDSLEALEPPRHVEHVLRPPPGRRLHVAPEIQLPEVRYNPGVLGSAVEVAEASVLGQFDHHLRH
mmetsp:Transcript_26870/g.64113  ORF Transcript_26870/g.64113 Transcript_26870/m.64113 type:complete len:277 (-) Transcript_26870:1542-2372(-)